MRYVIGAVILFVVTGVLELAGLHFVRYLLTGISAEFGLGFITAAAVGGAAFIYQRREQVWTETPTFLFAAYSVLGCAIVAALISVTIYALVRLEPGQIIAGLLVGAWIYPLARFAGRVEDRENAETAAAEAAHRSFP